jgi:hypothetical protein
MLWQVMFFMETDLTHVLATALRCPDLHKMTRDYLRNRYLRLRGRPGQASDESGWSARDTRIARWYAPFVLIGGVTLTGFAATAAIPVLAGMLIRMYEGARSGRLGSPWFWDSTVAGLMLTAQFAVVATIMIRDRQARARTPDGQR